MLLEPAIGKLGSSKVHCARFPRLGAGEKDKIGSGIFRNRNDAIGKAGGEFGEQLEIMSLAERMQLRESEESQIMDGDDLLGAASAQREGVVQRMNDVDPFPEEKKRHNQLFQDEAEKKSPKIFAGTLIKPDSRGFDTLEIMLIALYENG